MTPTSEGVSIAETVIDVRSSEFDSFGHVNHAVFLTYLGHARFEAIRLAGFSGVTQEIVRASDPGVVDHTRRGLRIALETGR
jgi:acyl-CoA thioesterase FadM